MQNESILAFAEILRGKNGIESHNAILVDSSERVDIIRGKDLVRWVKENAGSVQMPIPPKGKTLDAQASDIGTLLLHRGLLVRCQRKYNKPPPGMDRLAKFPKKLIHVQGQDAMTFNETDFYGWRYEKPTSISVYILSALAAIGVILICLFPIAPHWVKISVVYFLAALLTVLVGILAIRAVIALASYIGTGRTVWIFPNILADDKGITELLSPLIAVEEPNIPPNNSTAYIKHLLYRCAALIVCGGLGYILYSHSPNTDSVKKNAFKYRDELFDLLNVNDNKMLGKGNGTDGGNSSDTHATDNNDTPTRETPSGVDIHDDAVNGDIPHTTEL